MLGIVVCTHSHMAQGLRDAVEMIAGEQQDFDVVGFMPGDDMLQLSEQLKALARHYEQKGQRYVFVVDLFGATPFNASAYALAEFDTSIITGANLPLLLELVGNRASLQNYEEYLEDALKTAKLGTKIVGMRQMFSAAPQA